MGALSVGTLLVLTGCGIGASALVVALDAAVLLDLVPMSIVESMKSGEYLSLFSESYNTVRESVGKYAVDAGALTEAATVPHDGGGASSTDVSSQIWERYAALGVSGMSIVAKELLFRYTL